MTGKLVSLVKNDEQFLRNNLWSKTEEKKKFQSKGFFQLLYKINHLLSYLGYLVRHFLH